MLGGLFAVFVPTISYMTIERKFGETQPLPFMFSELFRGKIKKDADYEFIMNWILDRFFSQVKYTTSVSKTQFDRIVRLPSRLKLKIKKGRCLNGYVIVEVFPIPAQVGVPITAFSTIFELTLSWYSYLNPRIIKHYIEIRQTLSILSLACANWIIRDFTSKVKAKE